MRSFTYETLSNPQEETFRGGTDFSFIAGGTTLVDLMKLEVMKPARLVDLSRLPMRGIEMSEEGLRIGALEKMSDVAVHPEVAANYPVISEALFKSASAQIRNMASIGGNLLQRTRCGYFRDVNTPCNERSCGGSGRPGASVRIQSGMNERLLQLDDLYLLPGDSPDRENRLHPGELITEIRVPRLPWARRSTYLKIRDRDSYEFALTSAAVALDVNGDQIRDVRIAVGGVGTKPWSLPKVREALTGKPFKQETIEAAARLAAGGANPLRHNGFKVDLVQRTVVRAFMSLGGLA